MVSDIIKLDDMITKRFQGLTVDKNLLKVFIAHNSFASILERGKRDESSEIASFSRNEFLSLVIKKRNS